ncbi:GIY-YIG nuclease family protein [Heliophilum fasciatum]|uniref:GIY-YIG catalytic domain-containing protein n=1 Tax=Heliophilum fasciatum TaxID=35700 RepID=A0A4R2S7Y6_9FIRM|nr:GIY-YIG nuclease family protein [Heliophilum fasciatum]MCW2276953.1 hypothetical protein [Heliophilum fasciatum]TCP68521.1 GIY-YIG catalytic domain-containing protein [Heliophilum fasciatum]
MNRRKELKRLYKETPRPMGVYQIKNGVTGKILVGSSTNLPGKFNSHRFQLQMQCHRDRDLQQDWNRYGQEAFSFDILEQLKAEEIPQEEWRDALDAMEAKWLTALAPYGEQGYNRPPK